MPRISIVVPAFNAERTLSATLRSIAGQTYINIEVLVVDDGSTDGTEAIAAEFARNDPRFRAITTDNGGVARARNLGVDTATGAFFAPVDADDLWHPRKLELQLARLLERPEAALVYTWHRRIDAHDRLLRGDATPVADGAVFHRHLAENFISNGSSPMIRMNALTTLRYDPTLQDAGHGGCEDYKLQLEIARVSEFACVPAFLTGYRRSAGSMSGHVARMIRSHIAVLRSFDHRVDDAARRIISRRLAEFEIELARNRAKRSMIGAAVRHTGRGLLQAPLPAMRHIWRQIELARSGNATLQAAEESAADFLDVDPFAITAPRN